MATDQDNRQLSTDAANAILTAITEQADHWTNPDHLKHLAEAYATVVGAMPRATPQGRGRAVVAG